MVWNGYKHAYRSLAARLSSTRHIALIFCVGSRDFSRQVPDITVRDPEQCTHLFKPGIQKIDSSGKGSIKLNRRDEAIIQSMLSNFVAILDEGCTYNNTFCMVLIVIRAVIGWLNVLDHLRSG